MKAVALLKEARYSDVVYMTNEQAEQAYITGRHNGICQYSRYVPTGFYSTCLSFENWLYRYHIRIV